MGKRFIGVWAILVVLPGIASAAEVTLKGAYGTREVCAAIETDGNPAKAFENVKTDPILFAKDGFDDAEMSCTFDTVSTPPGQQSEIALRSAASAACRSATGPFKSAFRITERRDSDTLTVVQDDREPFTLHLCPEGKTK